MTRCCECDFLIDERQPHTLTEFGWAHPMCAPIHSTIVTNGASND